MIGSKNVQKVNFPTYMVTFKVLEGGVVQDRSMSMSAEQLQDVVIKLKDAVGAAGKLVAT
jgi:hypothetical protein